MSLALMGLYHHAKFNKMSMGLDVPLDILPDKTYMQLYRCHRVAGLSYQQSVLSF